MALHVIPVDDVIEHERHHDCPCAPTAEPVEREDGSTGWQLVHRALDGRDTPPMP